MGVCEGCALNFHKLASPTCMKCKKLQNTASDVERLAIENQPQCLSCSVIFPFMKSSTCGGCAAQPAPASGMAPDRSGDPQRHILDRSIEYQKSASQHRLNQPSAKQNASLQAATVKKENLTALKKQSRSDTITVEAMLNIFPLKGGNSKKAQLLSSQKRWNAATCAKDVLLAAKNDLEIAYKDCPPSQRDGAIVLNFADVKYGISKSAKAAHNFAPTEANLLGTIEELFHNLNREGKLSDTDFKTRNISLQIYAYEADMDQSSEDEDGKQVGSSTGPGRRYTSTFVSRVPKSAKRKASGSISSTTQYTSAYRPRKSAAPPVTVELDYDEFKFSKTTYTTDLHGNVNEKIHSETYTIKIARQWQQHINGDKPKDGYIAQGLTKFVFQGLFDGKRYAIFQCKSLRVTESQNLVDLTAEIRLLSYGQYFADSFAKRAAMSHVNIPAIRWNSHDAFLGSVDAADVGPPPLEGNKDYRTLIFKTFLAAPLLSTSGLYTERKFSGSDEAGDSVDETGRAIDAFAHHVLVDSHGSFLLTDLQGLVGPDKEVILFDPQAHSLEKNTGFWDGGRPSIVEWLGKHKCKAICKKLGLKDAPLPELNPSPLRHGFP